jgi:hypothetical protein
MEAVIGSCQRQLYITRAKEFQEETVQRLEALLVKLRTAKEEAIKNRIEDWANLLLFNEYITEAFLEFAQMWVQIKNDEMDRAWDSLINAQMAARHALLVRNDPELQQLNERLHLIESVIFPPQMFVSPGFTILEAKCSICGGEYGECGHMKGRVYMGQLCARIIKKWNLSEVSLVDNPSDKHCRALSFGGRGNVRHWMTWRLLPGDDGKGQVLPSEPYFDE